MNNNQKLEKKMAGLLSKLESITDEIRHSTSTIKRVLGNEDEEWDAEELIEVLEDTLITDAPKLSARFHEHLGSVLSWIMMCDTLNFIGEWSVENDDSLNNSWHDHSIPAAECAKKLRKILATCHSQIYNALQDWHQAEAREDEEDKKRKKP